MKDADDDLDLALVADDLAGALDPERSQALHERLAADPAAAGRYAEFARMLDGVSALLANEQTPPVPDDVVRRLDAAFAREVDTAAAHGKALARLKPDPRRTFRGRVLGGRSVGGWGAGLIGAAAIAGVVAVVVHGGGGSSNATSSSAGASKVSSGSSAGRAAAPAAEPSPAATRGVGASTSGPSTAGPAKPMLSPAASGGSVVVTAANLAAVVRSVYPLRAFAGSSSAAQGGGPTHAVDRLGTAVAVPATCRPADVPGSVPLLAAELVRFAGRPAVLLVLAEPTNRPGTVRATVVAACGGPTLLSRQVAAAR
jgi:hypothetical protein